MQQQQSERGASQEEKRPTEREKATLAMNQGTGGQGHKSWVHPPRDGDFLEDAVERTKGKKTIWGIDLKGLECRLGKEESKGVQGSQRKENRSQAEPHREGLLRQRLRSWNTTRDDGVHGTGVETTRGGRKPLEMRGPSIAEDINDILEPKQARREITSCQGHE